MRNLPFPTGLVALVPLLPLLAALAIALLHLAGPARGETGARLSARLSLTAAGAALLTLLGAAKSVMMLHGPWVWDKALAAGSDFAVNGNQDGIPATPPAEGQDVWVQSALPPNIDLSITHISTKQMGCDKL